MDWINLVSTDQLGEIRQRSAKTPVVIFKHSTTCSISAMALNRLQRRASDLNTNGAHVYYLDLKAHRDVSNMIESEFDVVHESPQVLIIDHGKAVYHRSHGDIDPIEIKDFLTKVTS